MAEVSIIPDMKRKTIKEFVEKADKFDNDLLESIIKPKSLVMIDRDDNENGKIVATEAVHLMSEKKLKKGDSICLDFGDHYVGYVTLRLASTGSPQDAPAFLRLKFAEIAGEILDDSSEYDGWISKGWIQEEYIHIDVLPCELKLPRRYAFRFMEIFSIDTSMKFQVVVEDVTLRAVSAVSLDSVTPLLDDLPEDLQKIDKAALKTLQDCMQHVFEDGPKRDRRLWIGDLRLQAKTNYATFGNVDLVKRCMYLFAGLTREDGKIGACLFTEPVMQVDDTFLWDYSLFFISILWDYYNYTKDLDTVKELWPAAYRQIELALQDMTDGVLRTDDPMVAFIDWKEGLDRQAAAQGVWIYCLRQAVLIADLTGDTEKKKHIEVLLEDALKKAVDVFWDEGSGFFVSGECRQISWHSQVWMVLADVFDMEKSRELMLHLLKENPEMGASTPYAYHHVIEALLHVGEKEKALELMRTYWGGMIELGADTFWEAYDPKDTKASPYGSAQVNSFCHAWSCTPAWLLREYF